MNKMWVWVGFPMGLGVLLLLIVLMSSEAGAETKYKTVKTDTGQDAQIAFRDKKVGTGAAVKEGDTVNLSFSVRFGGTANPAGKPHNYSVGSRMFGPGFDEGLVGMKEGGTREITVPPELMPQEKGMPPGEIVFDVQVGKIVPPMLPPGHPVPGGKRKQEGEDMQ